MNLSIIDFMAYNRTSPVDRERTSAIRLAFGVISSCRVQISAIYTKSAFRSIINMKFQSSIIIKSGQF